MTLTLTPNIANGDDFYEQLLARHEGKSKEDSASYNARLILILANHIGDSEVLKEALEAADHSSR